MSRQIFQPLNKKIEKEAQKFFSQTRRPKKKREKCPSLIDKFALEAENRRKFLISREQGQEKNHPPQRKIRKEAEICIAISRLLSLYSTGKRHPLPSIAIRHRKAPKAPQRRRRHPTYECRLQIPSLNAVFEYCHPTSSSDAVFRFPLHVTVPGNREAGAPSPVPTTACNRPGWDGYRPSCTVPSAHR